MKLGDWQKSQKLNIHSFYPRWSKLSLFSLYMQWSKLSLFSLYGQWFQRYLPFFKIALFGYETWPMAKGPELAHTHSFYPRPKLSLFLFYGHWFLRYRWPIPRADFQIRFRWPIFKIFGHETCPLAKVPEVAHTLSFYPN